MLLYYDINSDFIINNKKMKSDYYLFLLSKIKGLGNANIYKLIKKYGNLDKTKTGSFPDKIQRLIKSAYADDIFLSQTKKLWQNIDEPFISIYDQKYPTLLKNIYDPPLFLFYRGNIDLLNKNIITIVGSRTLCNYHEASVKKIVGQLKNSNLVITSGMAMGIDSIAHQAALNNNLATIAVLGSSLNETKLYPQENKTLAQQIIKNNGLLISEYDENTKTQIHHFPKRNRILAGLANTTIVISGAKKSGTLITAQVALDEGRNVYALPGNINNPLSSGPNNLIKNGAQILNSAEDILLDYNINYKVIKKKLSFDNKIHAKIYSILQTESLNPKELSQKTGLSPELLNMSVSEMELLGIIKTNQQNIIEIV